MDKIQIEKYQFGVRKFPGVLVLNILISGSIPISKIADAIFNASIVEDVAFTDSEIVLFGDMINLKEIAKLKIKSSQAIRALKIPVYFYDDKDAHKLLGHEFELAFRGFLPGFAYLKGLPKHMHLPRKSNPQLINKGEVAIGGPYIGVYPQKSPGGWNVIGNCPVSLVEINNENPLLISSGDTIKLEAITLKSHELILHQNFSILEYNGITD